MPLTWEQFDSIRHLFMPRSMNKGELLLREGEIAKYGAFVCKGCLRSYVIDNKGKEHIIQFAPENWWLSDLESMINKKPTIYFIDAIEPSEILLADMPAFQKMMAQIPGFANSFQIGQQKHTAAKDKRIISTLTSDAEEKYSQFLERYLTIAQRVPLHMIASYLGISPETLSRVRKRWSVKK
jgi:CRP-like cAMP-binding protein